MIKKGTAAKSMMAMFMAAIWRMADLQTRGTPTRKIKMRRSHPTDGKPGAKTARMARNNAIGMRGRIGQTD